MYNPDNYLPEKWSPLCEQGYTYLMPSLFFVLKYVNKFVIKLKSNEIIEINILRVYKLLRYIGNVQYFRINMKLNNKMQSKQDYFHENLFLSITLKLTVYLMIKNKL